MDGLRSKSSARTGLVRSTPRWQTKRKAAKLTLPATGQREAYRVLKAMSDGGRRTSSWYSDEDMDMDIGCGGEHTMPGQ